MSLLAKHALLLRAAGGMQYLDQLPVAPRAVYSLRKLISTATVAVRVRRSSDSAEQDIGFAGDALDTAALASFVGSDSAYVATWYDQTANGFDRGQSNAAQQPRIVDAGNYEGKLVYDGTDDALITPSIAWGTNFVGIYLNAMLPTTSGSWVFYENSVSYTSRPGAWLVFSENGEVRASIRTNVPSFWTRHYVHSQTTLRQTTLLMQINATDATTPQHMLYVDGTLLTPASAVGTPQPPGPINFRTDNIYAASRAGSSLYAPMWEETVVLYNADTSSIRQEIESVVE